MIIYNKTWLINLQLISLVEKAHAAGSVSAPELKEIKKKYPVGFYSPNLFVSIGLFVLTVVIASFSCALLTLVFLDPLGIPVSYGWFSILTIAMYITLEIMVRRQHHYRSGVDDALLWISFGLILWTYLSAAAAPHPHSQAVLALFIFSISLLLAIRFSDRLMSLVSYLALYISFFYAWQDFFRADMIMLPIILPIFSGLTYLLVTRFPTKGVILFYSGSLLVLRGAALITFYASANYYLVMELSNTYHIADISATPYAAFLWTWTAAIPLVYLYRGITKKDALVLRVGLLLCLASAWTFWHYYPKLDLEWALILVGTFLLLISWFLTRFLKTPKHGLTYQDLNMHSLEDELKIESLIISGSASAINTAPESSGTQMGGGKFGGGGASAGF